MLSNLSVLWLFIFVMIIVASPSAYTQAYLDPGSGSFIIQVLVASILGLLVSLRIFGRRIFYFLTRTTPSDGTVDSETQNPSDNV
ncbi:MAG: hypothetical protein D6737_09420 [Chloroflexi bacterium]|nr:MAG: hypothetical protein CUN54_02320 [Phototrophicales bacterium]RMF80022.1 MAG: hypothetical protein D6737_09420 [Chloroflexota bacterium]